MPARILIVDDCFQNIRFLEARLAAEYYQVISASGGAQALDMARRGLCDIILLDALMPEPDGFETCRRLKADPATAHLPVIMVTALDQPAERLRGFECGADDYLAKPVDDLALLARLRSLTRLKSAFDALHAHAKEAGMTALSAYPVPAVKTGRLLLVEDDAKAASYVAQALADDFDIRIVPDAQLALFEAVEAGFDLALIALGLRNADALRLCAQIRALERTRDLPVILISGTGEAERARVLRALDFGVNDFVQRPFHLHELRARILSHLNRKAMIEHLRDNLRRSVEWALLDPLTGVYNRRHLDRMLADYLARGTALTLLLLDIDHFKRINDAFGHDAGDDVLRLVAQRLRGVMREDDCICRLGGEEFAVVMPQTDVPVAAQIAERARLAVSGAPFALADGYGQGIAVTLSAGLAHSAAGMCPRDLYRLADAALYRSKELGRNRVTPHAA